MEVVTSPTQSVQSLKWTGFELIAAGSSRRLRIDGNAFAFIWNGRYQGWDDFVSMAPAGWEPYRQAIGRTSVVRVGLRFVNRLVVPVPCELKQFFRTYPELSPDLAQDMLAFSMQIDIPATCPELGVTIRQGVLPQEVEGHGALSLDIGRRRSVRGHAAWK